MDPIIHLRALVDRALHELAADRGCHPSDLSDRALYALEDLARNSWRMCDDANRRARLTAWEDPDEDKTPIVEHAEMLGEDDLEADSSDE